MTNVFLSGFYYFKDAEMKESKEKCLLNVFLIKVCSIHLLYFKRLAKSLLKLVPIFLTIQF
jgi:hypothetical protein